MENALNGNSAWAKHLETPCRLRGVLCGILHGITMEHGVFHVFGTEYCLISSGLAVLYLGPK